MTDIPKITSAKVEREQAGRIKKAVDGFKYENFCPDCQERIREISMKYQDELLAVKDAAKGIFHKAKATLKLAKMQKEIIKQICPNCRRKIIMKSQSK